MAQACSLCTGPAVQAHRLETCATAVRTPKTLMHPVFGQAGWADGDFGPRLRERCLRGRLRRLVAVPLAVRTVTRVGVFGQFMFLKVL